MKKRLFFLIVFSVIVITAIAQQQIYTLDLQNGGFLLKDNGDTIIAEERNEKQVFRIKLDELNIDTIIVSETNRGGKSFDIKDSEGKVMMQATVYKNIHVGEKGFSEEIQLVTGCYDITWGDASWKVELYSPKPEKSVSEQSMETEVSNSEQVVIESKSDWVEEKSESGQEEQKTDVWKVAFVSLLIAIIIGFLIGQRKNLLKLFKKQPIFNVVENGFSFDLAAFAKHNKDKVKYDSGNLSTKDSIKTLVIPITNGIPIKGNQLKIMLANRTKIKTDVKYESIDTIDSFDASEELETYTYNINSDQSVKEVSITPIGNNLVCINSLTVETVQFQEKLKIPKEEEKNVEKEQKNEQKEEPFFSKDFQKLLSAIFSAFDDYKDLDENAKLELLKQDLSLAVEQKKSSSKPQEDKELENKEKKKEQEQEIRNKEKQEIEQKIVSWIKQNKYVQSLYQQHIEKKESFWSILKELLASEIVEPKQPPTQDIPLSERLKKKNCDDVAAVKAFVFSEYISRLGIEQLRSATTLESFMNKLKEFFNNIDKEPQSKKEEPKDMVRELVEAVNLQLPEDKRLNSNDVEQQLIARLALPTNFKEAELNVWKKVAEILGTDMVNADTLSGVIGQKVKSKFDEELPEKLNQKENDVKKQDLQEIKSGLCDIVDGVEDGKTIANVMQKVKGQINGARDRENNAINNIRIAYREQVGKDLPKSIELKEAIKLYKKDVPESVRNQEWERVGDTINSLGFGETNTVSEATLPSALNIYYEGRLHKEVTSQLNEHLKADRKDTKTMVNELNKALDVANEAETLCAEYKANSVTAVRDKLIKETANMEKEKKKVEEQKLLVEKDCDNRAQVISATVDSMRQQLISSVTELGNLLSKAGYMKPCSNEDEEGEKVAERNQDALIEQYDGLKEALLTTLPTDTKDLTPAEAKAKVQTVLEDDLAKAFQNKDLSQFSVIDKITRYYAYSRLSFMTENAQEADESRSLRRYGVVFNRSRMTAIYAQVNRLLSDFGIQLIVPTLFAERLGEGNYNRSSQDGDLGILCPHPEYWKSTIANTDKKDVIIDIAATGYCKNGILIKETEVIINNN